MVAAAQVKIGTTNDLDDVDMDGGVATTTTSPITTVVPDDSVEAVAIAALEQITQQQQQQQQQQEEPIPQKQIPEPPKPLPIGWVRKESRSQPDTYYYYNMETGFSTWRSPATSTFGHTNTNSISSSNSSKEVDTARPEEDADDDDSDAETPLQEPDDDTNDPDDIFQDPSGRKRKSPASATTTMAAATGKAAIASAAEDTNKRKKTSATVLPSKVRVLHILKKHAGSRRPSSWRMPTITATHDEAEAELKALIEILQESSSDPAELRATFEELARTESDCTSAKRGGDLGFFGPKKMQPSFEKAAFALNVGEMSGVVETSSGVHVLLRIG